MTNIGYIPARKVCYHLEMLCLFLHEYNFIISIRLDLNSSEKFITVRSSSYTARFGQG